MLYYSHLHMALVGFWVETKDIYSSFLRFQGKLVTYMFFPITGVPL